MQPKKKQLQLEFNIYGVAQIPIYMLLEFLIIIFFRRELEGMYTYVLSTIHEFLRQT